jgi:hypothetical protein
VNPAARDWHEVSTRLRGAIPPPVRDQLRRLRHRVRREGESVDWGNMCRTVPFSTWGSDGGVPVDRHDMDRFVERHGIDVRGHVLEVGASADANRFGRDRVTRVDVLDVDPDNGGATIRGDVSTPGGVPEGTFAGFLHLPTLQHVSDPVRAIRHAFAALAPGGVPLVPVPRLSRIHPADRPHEQRRADPDVPVSRCARVARPGAA